MGMAASDMSGFYPPVHARRPLDTLTVGFHAGAVFQAGMTKD
jgi:hypothetical protein